MIVAPRFVFLHLHKSGGTFVNACLLRYVEGARQIGYHLPRAMIPREFRALPVLGLVRNPWSYYVSWYAFQRSRPQPNALYRVLSENGALDFRATVRRMLDLSEDEALLERVISALPASYTNHGLNLPGFALEPIRGSGLGFYSWLYRRLYAPEVGPCLIARMERLRTEFPAALERVGQPVGDDMRRYIETAPAANTSVHEPYERYYDAATAEHVRLRDGSLIEEYGYTFGAND